MNYDILACYRKTLNNYVSVDFNDYILVQAYYLLPIWKLILN